MTLTISSEPCGTRTPTIGSTVLCCIRSRICDAVSYTICSTERCCTLSWICGNGTSTINHSIIVARLVDSSWNPGFNHSPN